MFALVGWSRLDWMLSLCREEGGGGFSPGCPPIPAAPCHILASHPGTSLPHTRPQQRGAGGNGADQDKPDRQSPAHSLAAAEHPSGCPWGRGASLRLSSLR